MITKVKADTTVILPLVEMVGLDMKARLADLVEFERRWEELLRD